MFYLVFRKSWMKIHKRRMYAMLDFLMTRRWKRSISFQTKALNSQRKSFLDLNILVKGNKFMNYLRQKHKHEKLFGINKLKNGNSTQLGTATIFWLYLSFWLCWMVGHGVRQTKQFFSDKGSEPHQVFFCWETNTNAKIQITITLFCRRRH